MKTWMALNALLLSPLAYAASGEEVNRLGLTVLGLTVSWLWFVGSMIVLGGLIFLPRLLMKP